MRVYYVIFTNSLIYTGYQQLTDFTDERYPIAVSSVYCKGNEANLTLCNIDFYSNIRWCSLNVVKFQCAGKSYYYYYRNRVLPL